MIDIWTLMRSHSVPRGLWGSVGTSWPLGGPPAQADGVVGAPGEGQPHSGRHGDPGVDRGERPHHTSILVMRAIHRSPSPCSITAAPMAMMPISELETASIRSGWFCHISQARP